MIIPSLKAFKNIVEETGDRREKLFRDLRKSDAWTHSMLNPRLRDSWKGIRHEAEQCLKRPMEHLLFSDFMAFHRSGERSGYEKQMYANIERLNVFALMSLGEPDNKQWIAGLEDVIWSICNEYTWVLPAHVGLFHNDYPNGIWDEPEPPRETVDLQAALTAFTLAEIAVRLEDRLSPWILHRIKKEVERRIFQVYFHDPVPQNWELKTNNWPAVCASGIGAAAIYLVDDHERLAGMLWRVLAALKSHLEGFDTEGATSEGVGYWQFGFGHYTYFTELLKECTDGQVDLLDSEQMRRIAAFPEACMLSNNKVINFSDADSDVNIVNGLIEQLRRRFKLESRSVVAVSNEQVEVAPYLRYWTHTTRTLLWTTPLEEIVEHHAVAESTERRDYRFEGHQWVISKSYVRGALTAFAAKGGNNAEPHNHNDLGHFIVHVNGDNVLADLGAGQYTRQYFQPDKRYETITCGSHGHSVPVLDGCRQGAGREYHAKVLKYKNSEDCMHYELDLTQAYDCQSLRHYERRFQWRRLGGQHFVLQVEDEFDFSACPSQLEEAFVTFHKPEKAADGMVRIGPLWMRYSTNTFHFRCESHLYRNLNGEQVEAFRIVLGCKSDLLAKKMSVSVSFSIEDEQGDE